MPMHNLASGSSKYSHIVGEIMHRNDSKSQNEIFCRTSNREQLKH